MNKKALPQAIQSVIQVFAVAVLYYLTARFGFLIAVPPNNITAFWVPSVLALGAVAMWGWTMGIGIFIGSFFVNWEMMGSTSALPAAATTAMGSTLQAWAGVWLLRHLTSSESGFRDLSETALAGVARFDISSGKILYANKSAAQMFGFNLEKILLGRDIRPYISDASQLEILKSSGQVRDHVVEILTLQGEKRHLLCSGSLLKGIVSITFVDVTDRLHAEKENRKLSRVVTQIADSVVITNVNGIIEYVNPAFEQLTGYNHSEIIGKTFRLIKSGLHVPEFYKKLWSTILSGEIFRDEVINRKKNGELYYEMQTITPIRNNEGAITHFVVTGKDITERKKSEEDLNESKERFKNLFESSNAIMLFIDPDSGKILEANQAAIEFYGYSLDQFLCMNIAEINQLAPEEIKDELQKAKGVERNYFIFPHRLANGKIRTVEVHTHPIKTKGQVLLFSTIYDITERKQIEEALNESKLMFHLLIESLPQNIYAKDIQGRFIFANQHYCKTQGRLLEEIVGKTDFELHPFELAEKYRTDDRQVIETGKAIEVEEEHEPLGEKKFFVQVIKTPFYDSNGHTAGTLGIFWDITERKQSEELLRKQSEQIRLLYEASQRLNRTLDLKEIYQAICDFMSLIAPNDGLVISAFDHETQLITCRAFWMDNDWMDVSSFPPIPLEEEGKGTQSIVIRTGHSMLANDYQALVKTAQNSYYINNETNEIDKEVPPDEEITRSALIVPLKSGGRVTGVIQVMSYHLNAYTEDQLKLLEALALHIASAEKNAMLYAQVQTELNERKQAEVVQKTVYQIAEAAQTAESLQDLYLQIHHNISNVMSAENFYIALYDEVDDLLSFVYAVDEVDPIDIEPIHPGKGLTAHVLLTGKSLLVSSTQETQDIEIIGTPAKVWLGVPLIVHSKTMGVMAVQHYSDPNTYTEREQRMLEFVSSQIASAIDRKQAEEAVQLIEKRNNALIENAPDGIVLIDIDGNFKFASPSAYRMFGYNSQELLGYEAINLIHPEDADRVRSEFTGLRSHPVKMTTLEYRFLHKDSTYRWIEGIFNNLFAEPGVNAMVINFRDITERKLAGKILQKSQSSLEMAQSLAHLGNWELDLNKGTGLWSKEMFQLFHFDLRQEAPTLSEFMRKIHPDDRQSLADAQRRALETAGLVTIEFRSNPAQNKAQCYKATIYPINDAQEQLVNLAGTVLDITEIKTTQRELEELNRELEKRVEERTTEVRQREATYRALFENSNDGIFLISPAREQLQANQHALNMLGYTMEEWTTVNSNQYILFEQQHDAAMSFQAVMRGEHVPLHERIFISKSGKKINVEVNFSAIQDASGKIILVQSVVRDITERKKAEVTLRESRDQLSAANAALEKASRLKDEFLASMSHELRTPLTGILGLSEALQLQTYGPLSEKQLKALKNIEGSGRHLLSLINDILDLSKIEAGKLDMQFEPCSVADICQASLQLVKGMAHQKRQNINFHMSPDSINVRADSRRLKQMLVNLLSNAVKFAPEGGGLGLEVQGIEKEKILLLSVWDKGIGIKPEELSKLFKPFVQLDSSLARQYQGTGLGLSLVQRMTELHGGSIKVESVPDEGSRFTIILPWSVGVTQPLRGLKERDTGPLKSTLVVEDNVMEAEQISRYLKEIGITSIVQPVIQGAMEKAILLHPSVILLDLHLPDGSGLDLLVQLKTDERTRNIPVIIASVEERRTEAIKLGAMGYLVKPFSQKDLGAELAKATAFIHASDPVMVIEANSSAPVILIADDNELIIQMLSDFLEAKGFRVISTRSGFELLERAPELQPDIMLVDIQMPGMDGMETIRRLRAHTDSALAATPVIAITALAMSGDREKCLQAGANDYMSKPIVLTKLVERINQFLKRKQNKLLGNHYAQQRIRSL